MKIAVLSQFFPPEPCAAANRIDALLKALVRAGHDVTVVTAFPSFPERRIRKGDRFRLLRREDRYGGTVLRLLTMQFGAMPGGRLAHWLVTALAISAFLLTTRRRFDVIIVSSPPITLAMPALIGVWRKRAKLIVDVRDVYPDVAIAMGAWRKDGLLARAVERVARTLYRKASLIATVTPTTVRQILSRGVPPERVLLATNGADDVTAIEPKQKDASRFLAVYAGNLGVATDVDILVDAAADLAGENRFAIDVVGDGVQGRRMRERVRSAALRNITLSGALPREDALSRLTEADVAVVPLRAGISDSLPTKIFDAFSVGCPVIVCGDGEAAEVVRRSGGGTALPAGDARALVRTLRSFASMTPEDRAAMGERGKDFVQREYSREAIMDDYCRHILRVSALAPGGVRAVPPSRGRSPDRE